jgi:hypothetical protein
MARAKGSSNPNAGRKAGVPNALTASMKESIQAAFKALQESPQSLEKWAEENPGEFYKHIWVKMLPKELEHGGRDGLPLVVFKNFTGQPQGTDG